MTLYGDGNKIVTLSASYNCGNTIAFFAFCPFSSLANSRCFIFSLPIFMPPLQAESVWFSNDSMDQDQHARAENLHPEPQSYSDDVGLGAAG